MSAVAAPADGAPAPAGPSRTGERSSRLLPLTGIVAVGLVAAGHLIHGDVPGARSDLTTVVRFYQGSATNVYVGSVLIALAAFFFIVFASSLRNRLRTDANAQSTATGMAVAGATIFAVGLTLLGGIGVALGDQPAGLDPSSIQALHALFFDMFAPIGIGIALFLVGNGFAMLDSNAGPRWLGWLAIAFGALALAPEPVGDIGLFGLALWIVITSVLLALPRTERR
jgi:hypothetical protein